MGTFLFAIAVIGNAVVIAGGVFIGLFVTVRRGLSAGRRRQLLAFQHDNAFHHPDKIRTPLGEWLFMGGAFLVVLIGLPVVLGALFYFVLPVLGHAWTR